MTYVSFPVIIIVHNDSEGIETTPKSLLTHTSDTDVLTVDNNSTGETPQLMQDYADTHDRIFFCPDTTVIHPTRNSFRSISAEISASVVATASSNSTIPTATDRLASRHDPVVFAKSSMMARSTAGCTILLPSR